jgi:predicted S18 family serine protease
MYFSKGLLSFIAMIALMHSSISFVMGSEGAVVMEEALSEEELEVQAEDPARALQGPVVDYQGYYFAPIGKIKIVVQHDRYPRETSWKFSYGSTVYAEQKKNSVTSKNKKVSTTLTVSSGGLYKFRIRDTEGDGICCDAGYGYWAFYIDDKGKGPTTLLYESDGDFGRNEEIQVIFS